jgi:hypothetical protein
MTISLFGGQPITLKKTPSTSLFAKSARGLPVTAVLSKAAGISAVLEGPFR